MIYHPLLVFGREIFRLCLAAITHGAYLAESRDIAAKLKTNGERFEELCKILDAGPTNETTRALEVSRLVGEINRYRFVGESGLSLSVIIGAVQRAVKSLLSLDHPLKWFDAPTLGRFAAVSVKKEFAALEILMEMHSHPPSPEQTEVSEMERTVWLLTDIAWMYTFQNYFRMKGIEDERAKAAGAVISEEQSAVVND